ncbi:MAG: ROK family protein [Clostridia bacterium]|nr:ROK family protein [Clostridia bacterium]
MNAAVQILDAIRSGKGTASKKDIKEATGLAWGTMCKGVDMLLARGYVLALREKPNGRGRPTVPLCINGDAAYYVGLDIGAAHTRAVVCNLSFQTVFMNETDTAFYTDAASFFDRLRALVESAITQARIERAKLRGIGVSVSGNVDFEGGVLVSARNFGIPWGADLPLAEKLGAAFGVPIYAMTTQAAASAAEYHFGEMAGCPNLLTVGLGVGIGSGVVSEGQLLISRPERPVGYIGHMLISGNENVCTCGFRGCLEAYSGGASLARVAKEKFPRRKDFTDAHAMDVLADEGDRDAMQILDTAASYNAAGIASMIQLYMPEAVVFGGGQCRADGYLYQKTIAGVQKILPRERLAHIKIGITTLGKYQSALGAARLVYEQEFGENKK